jgi:hypothetical protein
MRAFVAGISIAVAILCTGLLLFWVFRTFRGGSPSLGRISAGAVVASFAIWQAYLIIPIFRRYLAYSLLPIVVVGFSSAFLWDLRNALKQSPSGGPGVKIPAMAKRLPGGLGICDEDEKKEQRRIA